MQISYFIVIVVICCRALVFLFGRAENLNPLKKNIYNGQSPITNQFLLFSRRNESMYAMTGLYSDAQTDDSSADIPQQDSDESPPPSFNNAVNNQADTVIKCHSRQPSSGLVDREKSHHHDEEEDPKIQPYQNFRPATVDIGDLATGPKFWLYQFGYYHN